jgi:TatD DNase family protein
LRDLCRETPRVRAIGEIGLDFLAGREDEARQREVFTRQLVCAVELRLPVILHNRRSWSAFLAIWRDLARDRISGVCHHFSGSTEIARQALDAGLYLSFCGPLTYGNARRLKAAARYVPMDRLLTETDAPDLPPERWRGGLSVPWHVQDVVVEVARLKAIPEPEVIEQVAANFRRVLGLREEAPRAPAWGCEVPCPAAADLPREHPCRCQGQKQIGRCVANAPATVESQDQGLDDGTQPPGLDG